MTDEYEKGWADAVEDMLSSPGLYSDTVARLRALILEVEWQGSATRCPWCNAWPPNDHNPNDTHYQADAHWKGSEQCPAFSAPGVVR